jgi:glycosyltransferase involved in cell wall biosynthesis
VENALLPLAACDVMLLTSAAEGTPNVALEAQALGVVPVLTDVGGCRETLADGVTGRLMPTDDVDGMVSVLHEVLTDAAGRRRMAAAGPSFVAEHYGLARFVADFTAVYDAALGSRS